MTSDTRYARQVTVFQDAREFYDDATGDVIFQSSYLVSDHDIEAAKLAREEFMAWAGREAIFVTWA